MFKKYPTISLKIDSISKDGLGQGISVNQAGTSKRVEVPFSRPGDEVNIQLVKKKKGVHLGKPIDWITLSNERVEPRCKHFGKCGGCKWQHFSYEEQLTMKDSNIRKLFEPLIEKETEIHSIIPCASPWYYRNKMELSFSEDKKGQKYLGLILYGTRGHVFQMEECYLFPEWGIEAVHAVTDWWNESGLMAYRMQDNSGSLRTLTLRQGVRTGDRMVILTVSGNPAHALNQKQLNRFVSKLKEAVEPPSQEQKLSIFLRIQQIAKGTPTQFYEMLLFGPDHLREVLHIQDEINNLNTLQFHISPTAFFQPNPLQAEKLYSRALQLTQGHQSLIYDLYCGTGTLGICLAKQAKQVIGIELSPESSLDARENVKINNLSNIEIKTGDVGHVLSEMLHLKPDAIVVDPPRSGLDPKAIKTLLEIKAPLITYISCNPTTQAANIEIFKQEGYHLKALQPVDQFPQTEHVENIAVLGLKYTETTSKFGF